MIERGSTTRLERARHADRLASRVHGGCFCIHRITISERGAAEFIRFDWGRTSENECIGPLEAVYVDGFESGLTPDVRLQHDSAGLQASP
jgi:hypothetical protein